MLGHSLASPDERIVPVLVRRTQICRSARVLDRCARGTLANARRAIAMTEAPRGFRVKDASPFQL
jgi:hypothetical protein